MVADLHALAGGGLRPAAERYALGGIGSSLGLAPWELATASQVLFGAQGARMPDQGEGGALHQVLVQHTANV